MSVFNLNAKTNSNTKGVEEGVDFKYIVDGNGVKTPVINFENTNICPRTGIIELEPYSGKNTRRHHNEASFRRIRDKRTGITIGIPLEIDPETRQWVFQKVTVVEKETLDLSIPEDAMKWCCIKNGPFYDKSPNFNVAAKTKYRAIDREREAEVFAVQRRTKRKASDIAESLTGQELEDYALMLGLDPKTMSPTTLWVEVVKVADNEPEKFMKIHNGDTRVELAIIKRGLAMGVLVHDVENGINYGGLTLGFNEPEACNYLREHPATRQSIALQVDRLDGESEQSMKEPEVMDEKDAEIARLKKQSAELEAKLKKVSETKIEEVTEKIQASKRTTEQQAIYDEAKRLQIKGYALFNDYDKLQQKIDEHKAKLSN